MKRRDFIKAGSILTAAAVAGVNFASLAKTQKNIIEFPGTRALICLQKQEEQVQV